MLLDILRNVKDVRRAQARQYLLGDVLFATILACLSGARSYRQIHGFIVARLDGLSYFGIDWKRAPSYTGIRHIIQGCDPVSLEERFREYSARLSEATLHECTHLACDGKVLRGSFDRMDDRAAAQLLSVFATDGHLILAHADIAEKTNEIPAFQALIAELGLKDRLFTLDALHCQKKR